MSAPAIPLLEVRGLEVSFDAPRGAFGQRPPAGSAGPLALGRPTRVHALRGVDLELAPGSSLAIVGESGSGKTTLVRTLVGLHVPARGMLTWTHASGARVAIDRHERRALGGVRREIGLVFQDPFASLDPRQSVREIVGEAPRVHLGLRGAELEARVVSVLERVGLAREVMDRAPHAFSGGERQRIALARALALAPRLLILDEAFSALDASTQLALVELLIELRRGGELAQLFVLHDLALARRLAERVVVLYAGRVVEEGPCAEVLDRPLHPYTRALLSARLTLSGPRAHGHAAPVASADLALPERGCAFHPRCALALEACRRERPELVEVAPGRRVACPVTRAQGV